MKRETVEDVLDVVESYGPWGKDINESMRFQIVLADEVKRMREHVAHASALLNDAVYCFNRGEPGAERAVGNARVELFIALPRK